MQHPSFFISPCGVPWRILAVVVFVVAGGCSGYRKVLKSDDWKAKYSAAVGYFEQRNYHRSKELLEQILPLVRGNTEGEMTQYYYAYSLFHQRDYASSSYQFGDFARVYSRSKYLQEALFMFAFCLYKQSPEYNLDQKMTYDALDGFQVLLDRFPRSEYKQRVNELVSELRVKLEKKAYENSRLYLRIRKYRAALVAFDNFVLDFPDSAYIEEILHLSVVASCEYALVSIPSKQPERFSNAFERHEDFVDRYPQTSFREESNEVYSKIRKGMGRLKTPEI